MRGAQNDRPGRGWCAGLYRKPLRLAWRIKQRGGGRGKAKKARLSLTTRRHILFYVGTYIGEMKSTVVPHDRPDRALEIITELS